MQLTIDEVAFEAATISGDATNMNMQVVSRWVMEAIRKIGLYQVVDYKTTTVEVENYGADMPIDFYKLIDLGNSCQYVEHGLNMNSPVPTVAINNCKLRSNFSKGSLTITYMAIPVDENNRPVIDEDYYEPVKLYLISKFLELRLMARPELLNMKAYYDNEFNKSAGEIRGDKQMPSGADMRRIIRERLK